MPFWGSYFGGSSTLPEDTALITKLFYFLRESPNFRALAQIIDTRYQTIQGVLLQILASYDLDTAAGSQLDVIGAMLGLERDGLSDARYRRALRVQVQILKAVGSATNLMDTWTAWVGSAPTTFYNIPPAEVEMGGTIEPEDEYLLDLFIRRVAPAGVRLSIHVATSGEAFRYDSGPGYDQGIYAHQTSE